MAASAAIKLSGLITGTPTGNKVIGPINISSAAANGQVQQVILASGANTITIPTTPAPTGCVIQLNSANTAIVTLKGVAGDTGIAIGKIGQTMLTWDATALPASFVLNSAALQTGLITEIVFF